METILMAGGTGLIGSSLATLFQKKGYKVKILSRRKLKNDSIEYFIWDVNNRYIEENAFENVSHIINLAGANIGNGRWNKARKREILNSRVLSTNLLYETIQKLKIPLKTFITSSAVGIYGTQTTSKIFDENDLPANDFLGNVCEKWEEASYQFQNIGIRTVQIRTGVVLSKKEGALPKMMKPIQMGIGAVLGDGNQFIPWIHLDDLCNIYLTALQNEKFTGAYNAVASQHTTNEEFTKTLAKKMGKKIYFPAIPGIVLKLILGEMSQIVLYGSRISNEKIINEGFKFEFTNLENTLESLSI